MVVASSADVQSSADIAATVEEPRLELTIDGFPAASERILLLVEERIERLPVFGEHEVCSKKTIEIASTERSTQV